MTIRKSQIKRRKFNIGDSYKTIKRELKERFGYATTKGEIEKIWKEYLKESTKELFETGELKLEANIGTLFIYKLPVTELSDFVREKVIRLNKEGEKVNFQRVGQHYFIAYERHEKVSEKVRFEPCDKIKKQLREILKTTNKEYKPALLRYYK